MTPADDGRAGDDATAAAAEADTARPDAAGADAAIAQPALWTALIPLKSLPSAKSRLAVALTDADHAALVRAMRADTLSAVRSCSSIGAVVLVVDAPWPDVARLGADTVLVQSRPGLNGALRDAADEARRSRPHCGLVALVGDLPALTAAALADLLVIAAGLSHGYVADAEGSGTTLITARPGEPLRPAFGPGSAARHGKLARPMAAAPEARHDVDTVADLGAAASIGVGPATAAVLRSLQHHPVHRSVHLGPA